MAISYRQVKRHRSLLVDNLQAGNVSSALEGEAQVQTLEE